MIDRVGSVRFWNADKGFGFVAEDGAAGGDGTFVHARSLVTHASSSATVALKVGQRLSFTVARQDDGTPVRSFTCSFTDRISSVSSCRQ